MADSALTGYVVPTTDTDTKTSNGTTIVKSTDDTLDKNAFLKILTAELANQDPLSSDNDPTQYVSQLATFSSLEQMANLNGTMSLNSASNLIGKTVKFKDTDSQGNNYVGVITSVTKSGDSITLNFDTTENGKAVSESLSYNNVIEVEPDSDSTEDSTSALNAATNLIGKTVTFGDTDSSGNKYSGVVKSVVKNGSLIGLGIDVKDSSGKTTTQYFSYNDVVAVNPVSASDSTTTSKA